jgi:hypothetical protein
MRQYDDELERKMVIKYDPRISLVRMMKTIKILHDMLPSG